jgi:hypothetical protein
MDCICPARSVGFLKDSTGVYICILWPRSFNGERRNLSHFAGGEQTGCDSGIIYSRRPLLTVFIFPVAREADETQRDVRPSQTEPGGVEKGAAVSTTYQSSLALSKDLLEIVKQSRVSPPFAIYIFLMEINADTYYNLLESPFPRRSFPLITFLPPVLFTFMFLQLAAVDIIYPPPPPPRGGGGQYGFLTYLWRLSNSSRFLSSEKFRF